VKGFAIRERFWAALVHGSIMLALALWLFFSNGVTIMWLVWFTLANALGSGLFEIALARLARRHVDSMLLTFGGAVSLLAAIALIAARNAHVSGIVTVLGIYAILYGAVLIIFSLRLHGISKHLHLAHHA
jgi:uncharacterized membrane protein HdeD (DUF308 family)